MRRVLRRLYGVSTAFGIDPMGLACGLAGALRFLRTIGQYRRLQSDDHFPFDWSLVHPCLRDYTEPAGHIDRHYFYQDLWAARKIYQARPKLHVDIGSRIDGFVAHLLCFMPVTVMDVRALPSLVDGLTFVQSDASNLKHFGSSGLESVSSLHAIEHFGLGRYGDPVNPDAPFEAMRALVSVLGPGGILYLAVPIGVERLEFNAHRVFAPSTILQALAGLRLVSFSAIDDEGHYHEDVSPDAFVQMWYACGLFEFTK